MSADDVLPRRRVRVLEVGHEDAGAGVECVDHHLAVGEAHRRVAAAPATSSTAAQHHRPRHGTPITNALNSGARVFMDDVFHVGEFASSKSAMKTRAPELSALIIILRSAGPVISQRRSRRSAGAGAIRQSASRISRVSRRGSRASRWRRARRCRSWPPQAARAARFELAGEPLDEPSPSREALLGDPRHATRLLGRPSTRSVSLSATARADQVEPAPTSCWRRVAV